jgi:putative transcriptional regulator
VESVIDEGEALLELPKVASRESLANELAHAGVHPEFIRKSPNLKSKDASKEWVKRVRSSVGLTQKEFSVMFGVDLKTLQKYEQGDSVPAAAVKAYLQTIEANPEKMMRMRIEG